MPFSLGQKPVSDVSREAAGIHFAFLTSMDAAPSSNAVARLILHVYLLAALRDHL